MLELFKTDVLAMRKSKDPLASVMVFHLDEIQKIGKNDKSRVTSTDEAVYQESSVQTESRKVFQSTRDCNSFQISPGYGNRATIVVCDYTNSTSRRQHRTSNESCKIGIWYQC
jgi:hypothetical protein